MDVTSRRHVQARSGPGLCYSKPAKSKTAGESGHSYENRGWELFVLLAVWRARRVVHRIPLCQTCPEGTATACSSMVRMVSIMAWPCAVDAPRMHLVGIASRLKSTRHGH